MLLKGILMSLALGYVICVVAKKQEGILKSLGYAIGISILVLTLGYGLVTSVMNCPMTGKICSPCGMSKVCRTMAHR